ncbi:MAG TPA: PAS domain S-box protein [Gammaproteobacteria bacterium]|nr:PAS domain S-box protein [Gammaproteobacteria bacterium]
MKPIWPTSLRARLLLLVAACILPVIVLAAYTAIERYRTSIRYTYDVAALAADAVEDRYQSLISRSHDLLTLLATSQAITAPPTECSRMLAAFQAQMPVYENLDVVSLKGEFVCSAIPLPQPFNASSQRWFKRVLQTHQFTSDVISRGRITHKGILIFSAPHLDGQGNLIGMINAAASPHALEPSADEGTLSNYAQITIFSSDGTVLMYYPGAQGYVGSNQSQAALFKAALNAAGTPDVELPGLDGKMRFYTLRHISTDAPDAGIYVASGIDGSLIKRLAFLPLVRDISIIALITLFIILASWRASGKFVKQRIRPLLSTLKRIGAGELGARSGLAEIHGEIGAIARGVDSMAEHLEARVASQRIAESARVTSEERYKELLEQASDSIMVRRVSGELVFVNDALCKMLGYGREELLKTRVTHLVDESNLWRQRLKVGESLRFESWMRHRDGHNIPVEVSSMRLSNGDIQSIHRDISQRLETQRQLRESERHYRALVEGSMLGILLRRIDGEIIFVNQAFCSITGYSRDELLSMRITALVDPSELAKTERVRNLGNNESTSFQSLLRHKNGNIIYVDVSARRIDNLNIQVVINDVSNRVQAEQRFAEERNFVFHAIETLPGVFYVFNAEGRFLRWNKQMEKITGYDTEEMGQITSADIMPPERRAGHLKTMTEILSGAEVEGEAELYCKDGRRIPYYFVARHFEWLGQNCVVGMGVDLTERNQAEQLALKYLNEMQQLSARILESQEEERRHIARELHDELGQGLTATLLSLKSVEDQIGTSPMAVQVKHASSMITVLTQQVRALSLNLRPSVLDDLGLVAAISWYIRERVESTGLRVVLSIDKNLPRLTELRETACFRVLQSALTNILRHAQAQEVQIGLQQADGNLVLVIRDDGRGFDVKAARQAALEGKSMGLLGMEERIRLAGGVLEVISNPGQGTVVRVALPLS